MKKKMTDVYIIMRNKQKYPFSNPQILLYDEDNTVLAIVNCKIKGGSIVSKKNGTKIISIGTAVKAILSVRINETGTRSEQEVPLFHDQYNICWPNSKIDVKALIS